MLFEHCCCIIVRHLPLYTHTHTSTYTDKYTYSLTHKYTFEHIYAAKGSSGSAEEEEEDDEVEMLEERNQDEVLKVIGKLCLTYEASWIRLENVACVCMCRISLCVSCWLPCMVCQRKPIRHKPLCLFMLRRHV